MGGRSERLRQIARLGGDDGAGQPRRPEFLGAGCHARRRPVFALLFRFDLRQEHVRHRPGHQPDLDPADPAYKWTDEGIVIQSSNVDNFNTIDPAITQDAEGRLWLAFGSFWAASN